MQTLRDTTVALDDIRVCGSEPGDDGLDRRRHAKPLAGIHVLNMTMDPRAMLIAVRLEEMGAAVETIVLQANFPDRTTAAPIAFARRSVLARSADIILASTTPALNRDDHPEIAEFARNNPGAVCVALPEHGVSDVGSEGWLVQILAHVIGVRAGGRGTVLTGRSSASEGQKSCRVNGRLSVRSTGGVSVYLTAREAVVARGICDGYSNGEIAARLGISLNTVRSHLIQIYRKLDTSSRVSLAMMVESALRRLEAGP